MFVHCPGCGSTNVRHSHRLSVRERIASLFGRHTLRCRDCHHRFSARLWPLSDLRFARCPQCYRTKLGVWSQDHYQPRTATLLLMWLGAKPVRCEYCRYNFVSFRAVKERYMFPKRRPEPSLNRERAAAE